MRRESIKSHHEYERTIFNNGNIALARDITHAHSDSVMLTDTLAILLCRKGNAKFNINGKSWDIDASKMVVVPPNVILHGSLFSIDFECVCVCLSVEYILNLIPLSKRWNFRDSYEASPVLTLSPAEIDIFMRYFDLMCSRAANSNSDWTDSIIDSLTLALVYELEGFRASTSPERTVKINSADNIYAKFGALIYSTYPRKRDLAYYAQRLNITQKYLSTICKKITGKTAKELLDRAVVDVIEHQLTHTTKTIKEIAFELEFPDTTSFGKFVKRNLGISPMEYRNQSLMPTEH